MAPAGRTPGRAYSCRRRRRRRRGSRCGSRGRRGEHVAGQDPLAEAGREALDLGLHALDVAIALARPVDRARAVTVAPRGVLPRRRSRGVGERLLPDQHERLLGQRVGDRCRAQDLVRGAAEVHGAGLARLRRLPRDRAVERPVDLQRRRAEAVAAQRARIGGRQRLARERGERGGHHVGDHERRAEPLAAGQLDPDHAAALDRHAADAGAGAEVSSELGQVREQRVREPPRAALGAGPADAVAEQVQIHGGHRAAGADRRHVRVHRRAVQPCARAVAREQLLAERARRHQHEPRRTRASPAARARRPAAAAPARGNRRHDRRRQRVEALEQRRRERAPALAVAGSMPSSAAAVASRSRCRLAARPSGSGCARHTGGCTQCRPWRSSGIRANTGEAAADGYTEEKVS